jgi:hypothetical protein
MAITRESVAGFVEKELAGLGPDAVDTIMKVRESPDTPFGQYCSMSEVMREFYRAIVRKEHGMQVRAVRDLVQRSLSYMFFKELRENGHRAPGPLNFLRARIYERSGDRKAAEAEIICNCDYCKAQRGEAK